MLAEFLESRRPVMPSVIYEESIKNFQEGTILEGKVIKL